MPVAVRLLLSVLVLLLLAGSAAAAPVVLASDADHWRLAPDVEILEDPSGALTIDDIRSPAQAGRFRPTGLRDADINFGYSSSAWWLRITVVPVAETPRDWILEVAFPTLDAIEYFGPDGRNWTVGDLYPFAARPVPNRNFVFPVALRGTAPQTFHLRVASGGSLTVPLTLWRGDAFLLHNQDAYAGFALYFGLLLALIAYNLLLFVSIRDPSYFTYVLFAGWMGVAQLSLNGFGNQYLWPDWPQWGNAAYVTGFAATGFFGAIFTRGFLDTRRRAPYFDAAILALAGLFLFCAVSPLFLPYRLAAIQTSLTGAVFSFAAVAAALRCLMLGQREARMFLVAWLLLLCGVALLGLRNMGWLPTTFTTTYGMQIGSALEMVLLSFALADRINTMRRDKDAAREDALRAKQELVDVLQRSGRDLAQRVAERTTELETANARLRESERQLQTMTHSDPLTGLANRLLLEARLDHEMQQTRRTAEPLGMLLIDLDHFKPVNDQYGHAIGDEVLREVAARMRKEVREVDTVARLGGDEFVVVLSAIRDEEDAVLVAEKLVTEMRRPFRVLGLPLELGASVGIAIYGGDALSAAELLRRADSAMYAAKAAGRGCFRVYATE
jgi:diguanylate cyclase (GGDEF)-like protein